MSKKSGKLLHCLQLNYKKHIFSKSSHVSSILFAPFFLGSAAVIKPDFSARHPVIKENC
jgi:hypothetical protein